MGGSSNAVHTGGGAYVGHDVQVQGGDFVGRDQIVYHVYQGTTYPRLNYRAEVAGVIDFYTRAFVGRRAAQGRVTALVGQATAGYLLLKARPGYGKSALLAHLVRQRETGQWPGDPAPALLYFFIRQAGKQDTPMAFLQALNAQLLDLLDLPGGVPPEIDALRGQFSHLWAMAVDAARPEAPLLLWVDGLDEMAPGALTVADLLPTHLAPNVHVVVSSRPNPDPLAQVMLEHPLRAAPVLELVTFDEADVAALLGACGAGEAAVAGLAPRVQELTGGEPLFARFVSQAVATEGEAVLAALEEDPPAGVEDYFRQQFRQLDQTAESDLSWDVLGLFVVSFGGLTTGELAEVLKVGQRRARRALDPLRRFLLGETRLSLMHQQLRAVLVEAFSGHERAAYTRQLLDYCAGWSAHRSPYALTYYVDHLHAAGETGALYKAVLDPAFRVAQRAVLGDTSQTLDDLRLALRQALAEDAPVTALACVAAYRHTTRTASIAEAILEAIDGADWAGALRLAQLKGAAPDWGRVLHLYLAWEAALAGQTAFSQRAVAAAERLPLEQGEELCQALLVRAAYALARGASNDDVPTRDQVQDSLATLGHAHDAVALLETFGPARPLSEAEAEALRDQLEPQLQGLEAAAAGGQAEAISSTPFLEGQAEETPHYARHLSQALLELVAHPYGPPRVARLLDVTLNNPYPRYRDIALVALARVAVAAPDLAWTRRTLRRILMTGLDLEGVTFTFDLPCTLLEEAARRGLPEAQLLDLPQHCERATDVPDRWGTTVRGHSAWAGILFRQGDPDAALEALKVATGQPMGFAGYATLHLLALVDCWFEFGQPEIDGGYWLTFVLDQASEQAQQVSDAAFRAARARLVETYQAWMQGPTPNLATGLVKLEKLTDYATRLACINHLSARWACPAQAPGLSPVKGPRWDGLKALVPLALVDGTTLDAVLARLFGLYLRHRVTYPLSDEEIGQAIQICSAELMRGQPWQLGVWHQARR